MANVRNKPHRPQFVKMAENNIFR